MKVAILSPRFCFAGRGGVQKGAALVANLLAGRGNEVHILCFARHFQGPCYPLHEGVRLQPLDVNSDVQVSRLRPQNYDAFIAFASRESFSRLVRISELLETTLLMQECFNPAFTSSHFASVAKYACETSEDAFWLRQAMLAHAAGIRFVHPAYASSVVADIQPFTYAFYNPMGHGLSHPHSLGTLGKAPKRKLICVEALRESCKNGTAAVRAFCEFAREKPGWSLHLYGRNAFTDELSEMRESYPYAEIVEWGTVADINHIYGDAHALIVPSYEIEGMPNVLIEAFSYGVPCIGFSDCPGVRDTIDHGVNGLLADRADPHGLASALLRISDPELRNDLGRNAKTFADENFTYDKWSANWLRMVHNAAQGLNNQGRPQRPAALDPKHPRSAAWSTLLQCHLGDSL